eukprot:gene10437-11531_t
MANHLKDFLDLSCDEPKFYLRQRAIPVGGKHSELAAQSLVAFEQNTPVKESVEDLAKTLRNEHHVLLKSLDIEQDPLVMKEWNKDLTKWPKVDLGNIFSYILEKSLFRRNILEIADKVLTVRASKEESELVSSFSQMLSFNDNSLKELEKATHGQSKSHVDPAENWKDHCLKYP